MWTDLRCGKKDNNQGLRFSSPLLFSFQVIVEKAPKARVPDLDKRKYLVPSDLTGNGFSVFWLSIRGKAFLIFISSPSWWLNGLWPCMGSSGSGPVQTGTLCLCFQLFGLSQCLTHVPYSRRHSKGAQWSIGAIVPNYLTVNISQGDPEVDLFQSQPKSWEGHILEIPI